MLCSVIVSSLWVVLRSLIVKPLSHNRRLLSTVFFDFFLTRCVDGNQDEGGQDTCKTDANTHAENHFTLTGLRHASLLARFLRLIIFPALRN
jgi:hypothetical protein